MRSERALCVPFHALPASTPGVIRAVQGQRAALARSSPGFGWPALADAQSAVDLGARGGASSQSFVRARGAVDRVCGS